MIGANRLLAATNRAINRVFGIRNTKVIQFAVKSVILATILVALFMFSVGLSAVIQALIHFSHDSALVTHGLSSFATIIPGTLATILPVIFTTTVFANVYGPITSVVILMLWAYIASLIFLYGAAITKTACELRPQ